MQFPSPDERSKKGKSYTLFLLETMTIQKKIIKNHSKTKKKCILL